MSRAAALAIAVFAVLLFAGCAGPVGTGGGSKNSRLKAGAGHDAKVPIPQGWAENVFQVGQDHNHRDFAQHQNMSTPNFRLIGHNPLVTDYHGKSPGGYFCGDMRETSDGRRLSVVHSWVSDVAYGLGEVTDPAHQQ